jgi:hypothetical protein
MKSNLHHTKSSVSITPVQIHQLRSYATCSLQTRTEANYHLSATRKPTKKRHLYHRCVRHAGMRYWNGRLKLTKLSHHVVHLASLSFRKAPQLIILSPQSLHLLSYIKITVTLASSLSLHTSFNIFVLCFGSIWNGTIGSMNTSEMFVEIFLSRESLAAMTLAVWVWAVELFSRTLLLMSALMKKTQRGQVLTPCLLCTSRS